MTKLWILFFATILISCSKDDVNVGLTLDNMLHDFPTFHPRLPDYNFKKLSENIPYNTSPSSTYSKKTRCKLNSKRFSGGVNKSILDIKFSPKRTCFSVEESSSSQIEISCVGKPIKIPKVNGAAKFSIGLNHICVASDSELNCSGDINLSQYLEPDALVESSHNYLCYTEDHQIYCMGRAKNKSLLSPPKTINPQKLVLGKSHACVLDKIDEMRNIVKCWGSNAHGEIEFTNYLNNPQDISVGKDFSCAIDRDKEGARKVFCFGKKKGPQTIVPTLNHPISITSSKDFTCAQDATSPFYDEYRLKCWGELGDMAGIGNFKATRFIKAGSYGLCLETDTGTKCLGPNYFGEVSTPRMLSKLFISDKSIVKKSCDEEVPLKHALSTGRSDACAILKDEIFCWGESPISTQIPELDTPIQIVTGENHRCALHREGIKCWGENYYGQLNVPSIKRPIEIGRSAGNHTCALMLNGKITCWGDDSFGQISRMPKLSYPVKKIMTGGAYSCVLDQSGLSCWGGNSYVPYMKDPIDLAPTKNNACALTKDEIICWDFFMNMVSIREKLIAPKWITSDRSEVCVMDQSTLKCFKENFFFGMTEIGQIKKDFRIYQPVSGDSNVFCGIEEKSDTIVCEGAPESRGFGTPRLKYTKFGFKKY
ncbi:MAG: hypothetical protein HOE90_17620 [Bacteriovoracaceae bacterium]|jgi:hypothetical protein|nr:hypothetical protein [Bacteriovoracaceae bacterium]